MNSFEYFITIVSFCEIEIKRFNFLFSFTLLQFVGILCDFQFLRKGIYLAGSCLISFQKGDIKTTCKVEKSEAKDHSSETAAEDLKRHL